jgi:hypothetical protein
MTLLACGPSHINIARSCKHRQEGDTGVNCICTTVKAFSFLLPTPHTCTSRSLFRVCVCVSLVASSTIINQTRVSVLHDLRMHQCGDPTQDTPAAHNQSSERVPPCICTCQLSPVKFHTAKEWRVLATNHPHQTKPRHRVWAAPARHLVSK